MIQTLLQMRSSADGKRTGGRHCSILSASAKIPFSMYNVAVSMVAVTDEKLERFF